MKQLYDKAIYDFNTPIKSYWEDVSLFDQSRFPKLVGDHSCDVCVIGGGFTGLSTAIEASKQGLKVILIEQNIIGWGASGRNGGQIWNDVSWGIENIEKNYGFTHANQLWNISQAAVELIDERIAEFGIECDKKNGGIHAATSTSKLREYVKIVSINQKLLIIISMKF